MSRYSKRPERRTRTYKIEISTIDAISALAQELGVFPSSVVDLLLKRALDQVKSGEWQLKAEPAAYIVAWKHTGEEGEKQRQISIKGGSEK